MAEGVDTSMYGTLQPAGGTNYLGMLGHAATVQNALNQNRLFQQEFIGKQAVGGIMQKSIDENGNMDYKKAALLLSTDPRTGYIAPQILQQWANKGLLDAQTTSAELDNFNKRIKIGGDAAGALMNDPDLTAQKVIGRATDVFNQGGFGEPHSEAAKTAYLTWLKNMPRDSSGKLMDGQGLRQYITQIAAQADGVDKSITMALGALQSHDTGGGTQYFYSSPTTGTHPAAFVADTLPVAQQATLSDVLITKANQAQYPGTKLGQTIQVPRNQLPGGTPVGQPAPIIDESGLQAGGNPLMQGSSSQNDSAGGNQLTGAPAPGATQPVAPALTPGVNPMAPTQMAGAPAPAQGGGPNFVPKAQSPMELDEQKQVSDYETSLNASVAKMGANMPNVNMLDKAMKDTQTGGGMEARGALAKWFSAFGVPKKLYDQIAGGSLSANQIIGMKAIPQIFSNLRDLINGAGRFAVLEFNVLQENSPTIETSPGAWKQMLGLTKLVYQLKQQEQDQFRTWIKNGNDPADWQNHWNHNLANSSLLNMPWIKNQDQKNYIMQGLTAPTEPVPYEPPATGKK